MSEERKEGVWSTLIFEERQLKRRSWMSEEKKEGYFLTEKGRITLEMFEAHIVKRIRECMMKEYFCDPRDDEMMSEIYPEG